MYTMMPYRGRREVRRPIDHVFSDRLLRSFFDVNDMMSPMGFRVDVRETADAYLLEAELPGVEQENISITAEGDVLTIAADVNSEKREQKEQYLYSERRSGHVERRFSLEGVAQDDITAAYRNGVVSIRLPKAQPEPERTARRIELTGDN